MRVRLRLQQEERERVAFYRWMRGLRTRRQSGETPPAVLASEEESEAPKESEKVR
jgi:hypothetical protein